MNARYRRHCTLLGGLFLVFWATLAIRPMNADEVPHLVTMLVGMGAKVYDVRAGRSSLEHRFLDLVARDRPPAGTPSAQRLR